MSNSKSKTLMLAYMGILTAIIIVLQMLASTIHFGVFSITLVLAPIVVGAALYGWKAGAWLGFVFGVTVLLSGDAALFLAIDVFGTVLVVLLKGTLSGLCSGLVYTALAKKNRLIAVAAAGVTAPVVNTGIFLLGCLVFFYDTVAEWAGDTNVGLYMITGLVGFNFIVEMVINLVLSSAIVQILNIIRKPSAKTA